MDRHCTSFPSCTDHSAPLSSHSADSRPTHVAFGSKVTIPDHILHSRQVGRKGEGEGGIWEGGALIFVSPFLFAIQSSRSAGSGETTARAKSGLFHQNSVSYVCRSSYMSDCLSSYVAIYLYLAISIHLQVVLHLQGHHSWWMLQAAPGCLGQAEAWLHQWMGRVSSPAILTRLHL